MVLKLYQQKIWNQKFWESARYIEVLQLGPRCIYTIIQTDQHALGQTHCWKPQND